jgi:hypothetical protein
VPKRCGRRGTSSSSWNPAPRRIWGTWPSRVCWTRPRNGSPAIRHATPTRPWWIRAGSSGGIRIADKGANNWGANGTKACCPTWALTSSGHETINLQLPALRERREDILLLVDHFLRDLAQRLGRPVLSIAGPLREFLETYDWPGNIRQLRNALESMAVLASGDRLTLDDLPATLHDLSRRNDNLNIPPGMSLEDLQREAAEQALAQHQGNRTHAAAALGISVRTLQRKLKAWGLDDQSTS